MLKTVTAILLVILFAARSQSSGAEGMQTAGVTLAAGRVLTLKDAATLVPTYALQRGVSKWRHGGYIRFGDDSSAPSFYTFDRDGNFLWGTVVKIPDAIRIEIHDFDRAEDGSVVYCALAFSGEGKPAPFIGWISPDGTQSRLVRTFPYMPFQIGLGDDGSVWTVGQTPFFDENERPSGVDLTAKVLRHFDSSGTLIQSYFSSRQFLGNNSPRLASGFLVAGNDRLGWYSPTSGKSVYVEMSLDGSDVHTYPGLSNVAEDANRVTGLALTKSGDAFLTVNVAGQSGGSLYHLDRQKVEWVAAHAPPGSRIVAILGSDDETLVFQPGGDFSKLATFSILQQNIK